MTDSDPIIRLNAALAGRYSIEHEIGQGGMATVYLAKDLRHGRNVAIKVLRPELAAAVGAERFVREIRTTAGLRHPGILPLFDSGEHEGIAYYVMPFVDGESLRARLDRGAQLTVDEALSIADEIADALEHAHSQGVVHRDVKPENILLEDGRAVVADFGIAQAAGASGAGRLTMAGAALGTPHYMSPEQWEGADVDGRSDLYALACLFYEMLAGAPPFTGNTMVAVMAQHLTAPVPKVTTARPAVPARIAAALERSLAKDPADRFSDMAQWRAALRGEGRSPEVAVIRKPPPAPPTPLLGRDAVVAEACERVRGSARVLTVTGVGGTGKTRLAIELFDRLEAEFEGGAAFVSLASVTDAAQLLPTVATSLDIAEAHGRSALDAMVTVIGDLPFLLILDNLEQVVDAAGDIAELVSRCTGLKVIATSRRPLKIGAEVELAVPPLELPDSGSTSPEDLARYASVELFVQRARRVKPDFDLTETNASAVADICRALDGLPLALELAAARVRLLDPAALLQRLDHALDLLTSGDRDLPLRQRTLRATISWSYSLLDEAEQQLLRRLSVFHEGWALDAVEQVCFDEAERWSALDRLESLVEKGLVRVMEHGARYSLLETIRAFAAEQLHARGEVAEARAAHAVFYLDVARVLDEGITCRRDGQVAAMQVGHREKSNMLAALSWFTLQTRAGDETALEHGMLLCGYLGWYWHIVGLHMIARTSVDTLLELAKDRGASLGRGRALFAAGMVSANTGELERALREWSGMLEDCRAVGDAEGEVFGLIGQGYINLGMGRLDEAKGPLEEATRLGEKAGLEFLEALARAMNGMRTFAAGDSERGRDLVESARNIQVRIQDYEGGGVALSFQASMAFAGGDFSEALRLYAESEMDFTTVGDKPEIARVQCEAGYVALADANLDEARRSFRRGLRTYDEVGSVRGCGQALIGLAATEAASGRTEQAVTIAAAAQVMSERAGVVVEHPMAPGVADRIEALRSSIPERELETLVSSGSALSPGEVLAMVAA